MGNHKTQPNKDQILPPLAPYWYSESEAMAYREGFMQGYTTGGVDMAHNMRQRINKENND